jgi:hypothetical protein
MERTSTLKEGGANLEVTDFREGERLHGKIGYLSHKLTIHFDPNLYACFVFGEHIIIC